MATTPNRNLNLTSHDALVLVHPTYKKVRRAKHYPYRLLDAIDTANQNDRPVFWVPDDGDYKWLSNHLSKRHVVQVPDFVQNVASVKYRVLRRRLQKEVDFIADTLGKRPSEITIGFAGMYAAACVFHTAQAWCREVAPWYSEWSDAKLRSCLPKYPIARAEILEELVVDFKEYKQVTQACS